MPAPAMPSPPPASILPYGSELTPDCGEPKGACFTFAIDPPVLSPPLSFPITDQPGRFPLLTPHVSGHPGPVPLPFDPTPDHVWPNYREPTDAAARRNRKNGFHEGCFFKGVNLPFFRLQRTLAATMAARGRKARPRRLSGRSRKGRNGAASYKAKGERL